MIGQTLSHYRITAALGAGGMGEVYRATDTSLHRDVAIKVLPSEVAQDPERLERFRREAHLLASLNHPNIATIYGLEEAEGQPFLALELVEGEDLAERLKRGAIPIEEAIEIARQVAEGLEEAHDNGIVHRDLKPANVKLTPDGKVKVLDFGLAKAYGSDSTSGGSSADLSQSPTLARTGTLAGVILGTAGYMSPEQASGRAVDKRADIWSFGVVLFEMLTGAPLFRGETASETLASVIKDEPAWDTLPASCPPGVRRLLRRCLRKRPRERLQDIGDARVELQDVQAGAMEEGPVPEVVVSAPAGILRSDRHKWLWAAAGLLTGGVAVGLITGGRTEEHAAPAAAHFVYDTPEGSVFGGWGDMPSPSPDGRHLAFTGRLGASRQLWIRPLDSLEARPLPGTEGANFAFWSPDGAWIGFFARGALKKVRLEGGHVHQICPLPRGGTPVGGTWGGAGTILFSLVVDEVLYAVPEGGGDPRALTTHDASREENGHFWPRFLPDGRHFLFLVRSAREGSTGVYVASLDAPEQRRLVLPEATHVAYASGQLVFGRDGTLLAQTFDAETQELRGEPVPVAENVSTWSNDASTAWFGVSPGVLAYRESEAVDVQLVWLDRTGERIGSVGEPGPYRGMSLSPDGRRLALEIRTANQGTDLWIMDVDRGVASRLTTDPLNERHPVWSPDGQELAFGKGVGSAVDVFHRELHRGGSAKRLTEAPEADRPEDWSRDGETLLYVADNRSLWALPVPAGGPPELVLEAESFLGPTRLSPNAKWLAYLSNESGTAEVYVEPYRRAGERVRVSVDGGGQPLWRADGRELFFRSARGWLTAVEVRESADRLEVGRLTELFETGLARTMQSRDYAVSADGQHFLVKVPVDERFRSRVHIVTHWTSLLE